MARETEGVLISSLVLFSAATEGMTSGAAGAGCCVQGVRASKRRTFPPMAPDKGPPAGRAASFSAVCGEVVSTPACQALAVGFLPVSLSWWLRLVV